MLRPIFKKTKAMNKFKNDFLDDLCLMGGNIANKIPGQAPNKLKPKRNHSGNLRHPFTAAHLS